MRLLANPESCILGTIRLRMTQLSGFAHANGERQPHLITSGPDAVTPALRALLVYERLLTHTLWAAALVTLAAALVLTAAGDALAIGSVLAGYLGLLALLALPLHRRATGTGWGRFLGRGLIDALHQASEPVLVAGQRCVYVTQPSEHRIDGARAIAVSVVPYAELGAVRHARGRLVLEDRTGTPIATIVDPIAQDTFDVSAVYLPMTIILADIRRRIAAHAPSEPGPRPNRSASS